MINLHNCETWFMLYADGELSAAERMVVEQFVEDHPGIRTAFDQLQALKFLPDDGVVFPDLNLLKRQHRADKAEREFMSLEKQYRFEPDLSVSFPNKQLLYKTESPVRALQETKQEKVLGPRGTVRWFMLRQWNWADTGARYVATALIVAAIGLLWFFFDNDDVGLQQASINAVNVDHKTSESESLVTGSDKSVATTVEAVPAKAVPEKMQRNDLVVNKTTVTTLAGIQNRGIRTAQKGTRDTTIKIIQPGRVDREGMYAERAVQPQTAATTSLAKTMPRSNLSPETRALAAERIATQESIAALSSSATTTSLSSTALDHSMVIQETKDERPRTVLRRLLDKINATIDQELEYEEDKKYIQVASFKIPLSKEEKK